jgi:acyl-CoA-binding protein
VEYIAKGPEVKGITNELKLKFYGLYKQATDGPCNEKEPSRLQVVKRMKWQAWKELGKMTKEEARKAYIVQLEGVAPSWKSWTPAKL